LRKKVLRLSIPTLKKVATALRSAVAHKQ